MVSVPALGDLVAAEGELVADELGGREFSCVEEVLALQVAVEAGTPVLIEVVSIVISALPVLAALSNATVPSFLSKRPRSVLVPKCLALEGDEGVRRVDGVGGALRLGPADGSEQAAASGSWS
jgi:hypothetical protein